MSIVFRNVYSVLYGSFGVTFFDSLGEYFQLGQTSDMLYITYFSDGQFYAGMVEINSNEWLRLFFLAPFLEFFQQDFSVKHQ